MSDTSQAPVSAQLALLLRSFRVAGFAENYPLVSEQAEKASLSYEGFLYELAKIEAEERRERRIQRLLHKSRLPPDKTLDSFKLERVPSVSARLVGRLCEGSFLA